MKKFGLLGEKLGHSLSPEIHRLIFAKLKLTDYSYELIEAPRSKLGALFTSLPQNYAGVNVTIPYKVSIMEELTQVSTEAAAIGAVNTVLFKGQDIMGFNTDYMGFERLLTHESIGVPAASFTVLGTGGAARAVLQYLVDAGAGQIVIVSRRPREAQEELKEYAQFSQISFIDYCALNAQANGGVLVNTTPVGMYPRREFAPVEKRVVKKYQAVIDLIYNPRETLLLQYAREEGIKGINGLYMLVAQAVAAEEIWLNKKLPATMTEEITASLLAER